MDLNIDNGREEKYFFSKFKELLNLYETSKRFIFLSEYYNKNHKISLSVINELRNALDHLMRSAKSSDLVDGEFSKAEGHLYRAAFDACEVIVINRLNYIYSFKEDYDLDSLQEVSPQYHAEYLPFISSIIEDLANLRSEENSSERLKKYEYVVSKLIEICDELDTKLVDLENGKRLINNNSFSLPKYIALSLGLIAFTTSLVSVVFSSYPVNNNLVMLIAFIIVAILFGYIVFKKWRANRR